MPSTKLKTTIITATTAIAIFATPASAGGLFGGFVEDVIGNVLSGQPPEDATKNAITNKIETETGINPLIMGQNFDPSRIPSETYNNPNFSAQQNKAVRDQLNSRTAELNASQDETLSGHGLKPGDPIPSHLQMQIAREAAERSAERYAGRGNLATNSHVGQALDTAKALANGGSAEEAVQDIATHVATDALNNSGVPFLGDVVLTTVGTQSVKKVTGMFKGIFNKHETEDSDDEASSNTSSIKHSYPTSRRR